MFHRHNNPTKTSKATNWAPTQKENPTPGGGLQMATLKQFQQKWTSLKTQKHKKKTTCKVNKDPRFQILDRHKYAAGLYV